MTRDRDWHGNGQRIGCGYLVDRLFAGRLRFDYRNVRGDSNYASSTAGPITENVSKSSSADTLTTSNASISLGQSVTFTDTIPL